MKAEFFEAAEKFFANGRVEQAGDAVGRHFDAGQAAFEMSQKFGLAKGEASSWLSVGAQLGISSDTIGAGFKLNNSIGAEFAVAADINPGLTPAGDNVRAPQQSSSSKDMKQAKVI